MRLFLALALVAVLALAALVAPGYSRDQRPDVPAEEHDFGSKIVMVATRHGDSPGGTGGGHMAKAKVRRLGDRYFLVGQTPAFVGNEEYPPMILWFPLQDVLTIVEYENPEDAMRHYEVDKATREERAHGRPEARPTAPLRAPGSPL